MTTRTLTTLRVPSIEQTHRTATTCNRAYVADAFADIKAGRKVKNVIVASGNQMIDHIELWYFGVAFSLTFSYCTGMHDMHAFAKRQQ